MFTLSESGTDSRLSFGSLAVRTQPTAEKPERPTEFKRANESGVQMIGLKRKRLEITDVDSQKGMEETPTLPHAKEPLVEALETAKKRVAKQAKKAESKSG